MSAGSVVFMLLTMGGIVALVVVCLVAWVKAKPQKRPESP